MVAITPDFAGNTIVIMIMIIAYVITLIYSVYMAVVNWRQAKVKDVLIETNEILKRIEGKLK